VRQRYMRGRGHDLARVADDYARARASVRS
jgi:hypothetical protein